MNRALWIASWGFLGYLAIWFLAWRYGPNRGGFVVGPFAKAENRIPVLKQTAWNLLAFLLVPVWAKLDGSSWHEDFAIYYPIFMLGAVLAFLHMVWRNWD